MMKNLVGLFLANLLVLCAFFPLNSGAQQAIKPYSSKKVSEHFDEFFKLDSRLVNGDFYQTPNLSMATGHPFYFSPEWKKGSVKIEGDEFDDLLLRYDIHSGQLILNTAGFTKSAVQLVLKKDRIESFSMDGNTFEPFPEEHSLSGLQFCQVLVAGEIDFLQVKSKNLKVSSGLADFAYSEYGDKFLRLNGEILSFKNRKTLYRLFPEHKSDLKEYILQKKLRFRRMSIFEQSDYISFCNSLIEEQK